MAVAMLATAYPNAKLEDPTRAELWIRMLADLPGDALRAAVARLICTATFCPSIAELRAAATGIASPVSVESTPGEAWMAVLAEIDRVGYVGSPVFADPLVMRAVQCVARWYDLCTSDLSMMPAHRARFLEAYTDLQRKTREGRMLPEALRKQIDQCRRDHLRGALDDAQPPRLQSAVARDALEQAQQHLDAERAASRAGHDTERGV